MKNLIFGAMALIFSRLPAFSQTQPVRFDQVGIAEGLSQSTVTSILQDRKGFMWFGTKGGLNKYDGYRFTVFKKNFKNENCLSSNDVKSILEDREGKLWVATWEGGVNVFDQVTEKFTHFRKGPSPDDLASDNIRCLCEDKDGNIWLGTEGAGLELYDKKDRRFRHFVHDKANAASLSDNTVNALFQDSKGNRWIGTANGGLDLYDGTTGHFRHFFNEPANRFSLSGNNVQFIFEDKSRRIWIGTYGGGLNLFDPQTAAFRSFQKSSGPGANGFQNILLSIAEDEQGILWIGTENDGLEVFDPATGKAIAYTHQDADNTSITGNTINAVCRDVKGDIWVGTLNGGINMINKDAFGFAHYKFTGSSNTLNNNIIDCLYEDTAGDLWIGTDGGGVRRFDRTRKTFTVYTHIKDRPASLCGNYVLTACEDLSHNIWLGTWGTGVSVFDPRKKTYRHFKNDPSNKHSLSSNYAFSIFRDSHNNIWIGTYGGGLDLYDPLTNSFIRYVHDPADARSLSSNYILTLQEDRKGNLWIGTDGGGLNLYDRNSHTFRAYRHSEDSNSLSSNSIRTIWEDKDGSLWLGTNFGLDRFHPASAASTALFAPHGLPDDMVTGVLGDDSGYLWVSTTRGLSRLNPATGSFRNFTTSDGLQGYEFKSGCRCRNGQMYFGGKNGFNEFFPDSIRNTPFDPPIVFTDFQIFNKRVEVAQTQQDPSPLKTSITQAGEIVLPYDQSVISFEFASLNYTGKEKKEYAYMLEGFDQDWHDLGTKNNVTYTNMDPGKYVLKVRGLNNDGQWSSRQASVRLVLLPPYWKTWWFRTITGIFIIGLILLIFYSRISSIKRHNTLLELEVANRTQELKEANHTKDRFFSILAHDLKNPVAALSGISGLLKTRLPELSDKEVQDYADNIYKASGSVNNLLINLLDWARTQTRQISCIPENISAYELVQKNFYLAEPQLKDKHISFAIDVSPSHILFADPQMIDTVLRNIISNSIKFTPANGSIRVSSEDTGDTIALTIHDTGIGMSREQIEGIYSMEKQKGSRGTAGEEGTRLGLVVSREFMEINKGSITIDSTPGKGSTFTLFCPGAAAVAITAAGNTTTSSANPSGDTATSSADSIAPAAFDRDDLPAGMISDLKGTRILLVDDNEEIRNYLKLLLSGVFETAEAQNGAEGIDVAREFQPTVIISDMLMPVMNGLEFCRKIKTDKATSHIPIILLTGQVSEESQLSGYQAGADVYLMKDISRKVLFQVILNFIHNQEKLRQRFAQAGELYPDGVDFNKVDKEFLEDVLALVEANLSDPDLDYKKICHHTAMSRTVLYAKFKALTGQGVHDFIKTVRVKKGLNLLLEGRMNITQIAYEVGFATPSYFSKSFTKQYGLPPREYLAQLKNKAG